MGQGHSIGCLPQLRCHISNHLMLVPLSRLQYERAVVMPTAEVESAYFEPLMQWRSSINNSIGSPFFGMFAQGLALAGEWPGYSAAPLCHQAPV